MGALRCDDPADGAQRRERPSALAQAVLTELCAEPRTRSSASEIGKLIGISEAETFPLLVELEEAGLVERHEGTRTEPLRWKVTETGFGGSGFRRSPVELM